MAIKQIKALVIDDSATIRKILKTNLSRFGIASCDEASDGKTGIAQITKTQYDIVFTDYNMPGCTGLDIAKHISTTPEKFPNLNLIAISSVFSDDLIAQFKQFGVKHFLYKPFNLAMFQEIIEPIINGETEVKEKLPLSKDVLTNLFNKTPKISQENEQLIFDFEDSTLTVGLESFASIATRQNKTQE